jgi:hypothetical protein
MFGFDVILAHIRKQVGLRTDLADEDGSLHAKMGDVKSLLNTINANVGREPWAAGKSPTWLYGKYTTAIPTGVPTTIVNIAGPRIILGGYIIAAADEYGNRILTIDGTAYTMRVDNYSQGDASYYGMPISTLWGAGYAQGMADYRFVSLSPANAQMLTGGIITLPMMYVNSSFKLEAQAFNQSSAGNTAYNILHTSV